MLLWTGRLKLALSLKGIRQNLLTEWAETAWFGEVF
jgi:hypothetical protein